MILKSSVKDRTMDKIAKLAVIAAACIVLSAMTVLAAQTADAVSYTHLTLPTI